MAKKDGYVTEEDNYVTVVLDTNLTPELIEEGFVREVISKIQTMRKEAGLKLWIISPYIRMEMSASQSL